MRAESSEDAAMKISFKQINGNYVGDVYYWVEVIYLIFIHQKYYLFLLVRSTLSILKLQSISITKYAIQADDDDMMGVVVWGCVYRDQRQDSNRENSSQMNSNCCMKKR